MFPQDLTDVAGKLADCCNSGREAEALDSLYAQDCVSVEALPMGEAGRETQGLEAIRGKHEWWYGAHDVHSCSGMTSSRSFSTWTSRTRRPVSGCGRRKSASTQSRMARLPAKNSSILPWDEALRGRAHRRAFLGLSFGLSTGL